MSPKSRISRTPGRPAALAALVGVALGGWACDGMTGPTPPPDGIRTIGPRGGIVVGSGASPSELALLVVPRGALSERVEITVEQIPVTEVPLPGSGVLRRDDLIPGTAYDFRPDGLEFGVPARLVIEYDEAALGGLPEAELAIYRIDDAVTRIEGSVVDPVRNLIAADIDHFSVYVAAITSGSSLQVAEAIGVADEVSINVRSLPRASVLEAVGVTDRVTIDVRSALQSAVAEAVAVADVVAVNVVGPARSDVVESVGVSDQVTIDVFGALRERVSEEVGVSDVVSVDVVGAVRSSVAEAVGVSDDVAVDVIRPTPARGEAWVALSQTDSVAVIDLESNTVIATLQVGLFPYAVAANPTRQEVYVANVGDRSLSIINSVSHTVVGTIELVNALTPSDVAVSRDGSKAYISDVGTGSVNVIDLETRTVEADLPGPPLGSEIVTIDPVRDLLYVASSGEVVVFDLSTRATVATITTPPRSPEHAAITPDGAELWLTDDMADEVIVIDLVSRTLDGTIEVPGGARGIAMRDGVAWVVSPSPASVVPIGLSSRTVGTPIPLAIGLASTWIALSDDGEIAVVTEGDGVTDDQVSIVDLSNESVLATLTIGSAPAGVAVIRND